MVGRVLRWGTALGCGYEAFTLVTGWLPTISQLVSRYPTAGPVLGGVAVGGLTAHFLFSEEPN